MSGMFESYEKEFKELCASIGRKLSGLEGSSGEDRKAKLRELETEVDEAESVIRRMDLEARTKPVQEKTRLLSLLRDYKADLNAHKRDMKKASAGAGVDSRTALFAGMQDAGTSADQRARLLNTTQRLEQQNEKIEEGKRTLLETEDLGVSILKDLHGQRETITRARDTLHGVSLALE